MTGFYGKLPARGDFLSRGLPREFTDAWDEWLQSSMLEIRETLGDGWLEAYLTSPLWRFLIAPGVVSPDTWVGVFMPSVDKVGRYFPMTIARELTEPVHPLLVADACETWFAAVEDSLLTALDDEALDVDAFESGLEAIPLPVPEQPAFLSAPAVDQGTRLALDPDASTARMLLALSVNSLDSLLPCCLWWGHGSEQVAPSLMLTRGLPEGGQFTAMINGQWSGSGWMEAGESAAGVAPTLVDLADL